MIRRAAAILMTGVAVCVGGYAAAAAPAIGTATPLGPAQTLCSSGYLNAIIGGEHKCLRTGEFCSPSHESDYERYGFVCLDGRLKDGSPPPTVSAATTTTTAGPITGTKPPGAVKAPGVGRTVLLSPHSQTTHCTRGVVPDRQCSPGAYYSGLTKAVLCSSTFHTSSIRNVPDSEKHQVEIEYGMVPRGYGRTIEIDHIISLELGGSNDLANLYPEPGSGPASYHVKDRLENKLHQLVCDGSMTLRAAQTGIARNWKTLDKTVFGSAP
jgi:hypothetical protein